MTSSKLRYSLVLQTDVQSSCSYPSNSSFFQSTLLRIEHLFYGHPEASFYVFDAYISHHQISLDLLQPFNFEACFFYTLNGSLADFNIFENSLIYTCHQTDDTSNADNKLFIGKEINAVCKYD